MWKGGGEERKERREKRGRWWPRGERRGEEEERILGVLAAWTLAKKKDLRMSTALIMRVSYHPCARATTLDP